MKRSHSSRQAGVTLIEVLVALLIMCIGLLGAAAIQLNALKYTDSSAISSQASFIAYDMMDRIRANAVNISQYAMTTLPAAATGGAAASAVAQDRLDFANNLRAIGGPAPEASIGLKGNEVTITIKWDDTRAANTTKAVGTVSAIDNQRSFVLVSRIAADAVAP
jgi:type IV pilus assembly protein PilV